MGYIWGVVIKLYLYIILHFSMTSSCFYGNTFVCGFDNSSIHAWSNKTVATTIKKCMKPPYKSYSYLSLDDQYDDDDNDRPSAEEK